MKDRVRSENTRHQLTLTLTHHTPLAIITRHQLTHTTLTYITRHQLTLTQHTHITRHQLTLLHLPHDNSSHSSQDTSSHSPHNNSHSSQNTNSHTHHKSMATHNTPGIPDNLLLAST